MKATDLRIWNYVSMTNKHTKLKYETEITASSILDLKSNGEISSFIFEPITITEQWLINFGFLKERDYENTYWIGLHTVSGNHTISIDLKSEIAMINEDIEFVVKYVHELQNLYFALTKKELEINKN